MRTLIAIFALTLSMAYGQTTVGSGTTMGAGVTIVSTGPAPTPPSPTTAPTLTPATGTYTTAQSVTITPAVSGQSCFYTTDGSTPTIASTPYSSAIAVSATTTIRALCMASGVIQRDVQATTTGWKCNTVNRGTSNGWTCTTSGGISTYQPSAWDLTAGTTANFTMSTTTGSGGDETQMLWVKSGAGDDSASYIAEDLMVEPVQSNTSQANIEMDMSQFNQSDNNTLMLCGLQCNQQNGNPAYGHWQIANEQNPWVTTNVTADCPLPTTAYTHVVYTCHRILGDKSGSGHGLTYFDALAINGVSTPLNATMDSYTEPWSSYSGNQQQIDATNPVASGTNPTIAARNIQADSVTLGTQPTSIASATYTIN